MTARDIEFAERIRHCHADDAIELELYGPGADVVASVNDGDVFIAPINDDCEGGIHIPFAMWDRIVAFVAEQRGKS